MDQRLRGPQRPPKLKRCSIRLGIGLGRSGGSAVAALAVNGILAVGDSITFGQQNDPFPAQLTNLTGIASLNVGVGGEVATNFDSSYSTRIGAFYNASTRNTMLMLLGTNDLDFGGGGSVGSSAATVQATLLSIVTKAKSTGFKVVVGTILPRTLGTGQNWDSTKEANRVAVNAWIKSTLAASVDRVVDYAAIAQLADTTGVNYIDGLHPTDAGNAYMAETARAAMGLPLATAATALTMTGPTTGFTSAASFNFTVAAAGRFLASNSDTTITVTPSDGGGGGTFTPSSLTVRAGDPTPRFSYRAASNGAKTISITNNASLTNPSNITYTASAGAATVGSFGNFSRDLTESGTPATGPFQYTSIHNPTISYGLFGVVSNLKRQVSTDGSFIVQKETLQDFIFGVTTSTTPQNYQALPYCIQCYEANNYRPFTSGSLGTETNAVTPAPGDWIRFRFTGTSLIAEVSKNSGGVWTTIFTWTGIVNSAYGFEVTPSMSGTFTAGTVAGLT